MSIREILPGGQSRVIATRGTPVMVGGVRVDVFDADTKQDALSPIQLGNINMLAALINPMTGQGAPLQEILYALGGITPNRITAAEFDALGLTATNFDSRNISAWDFDFRAKSILI